LCNGKGIQLVKTECWYVDDGDLTGALNILRDPVITTGIYIISCCSKIQARVKGKCNLEKYIA